ncbi:MAB_1171c family putative transporter [Rhodococcus sp. UNC363MFTsu5.1]|uniref:MAB_1171c family putative transporter n=1 Tax=Rhodococcus sp. UNC363MFTsu5.1 TaxID=1449069 RepID=UPI0004840537|nr:MAB_1171c family putative transporter [Rhodococcus sp. UNC363MFTsu5.1]
MWPLLIGIWVITLIRLAVMREVLAQRRINLVLLFWAVPATLRAPELQAALAPHLTDVAVIRPVTHLCVMLAGAAILGLAAALTEGADEPSWRQPAVYAITLALGVSLLMLSQKSRDAGLTIEAAGGWQCAVYFVLYSMPIVVAVCVALVICYEFLRSGPGRLEWVMAVIVGVMCLFSVVDNLTRPVAAFFSAAHVDNALTRWRAGSNDVLFLPEVALIAVVSFVPVVALWMRRRELRQLEPMWSTLTAAVPQVVLPAAGFEERLHRTVVEIWDATMQLEPYTSGAVDADLESELDRRGLHGDTRSAVRRSVQLLRACERKRTGDAPLDASATAPAAPAHDDLTDETRTLLRLARSWRLAATIAQTEPSEARDLRRTDTRERSAVPGPPVVSAGSGI